MQNNFFESNLFKGIVLGVAGLLMVIFIFGVGVMVGLRRADFSFKWADAYHENFAGPRGGFFTDAIDREFINANGVFGKIMKIDGQTLYLEAGDGTERVVLTDNQTTVRCHMEDENISALKVGDNIIVIGEPLDNGQIKAQLIRIMSSIIPQKFMIVPGSSRIIIMPPL